MDRKVIVASLNGLPAKNRSARGSTRIHTVSGVNGHQLRAPLLPGGYVDETLAGIRADDLTIADVVACKLDGPEAAAIFHGDDVAGNAEERTDEYAIKQEETL